MDYFGLLHNTIIAFHTYVDMSRITLSLIDRGIYLSRILNPKLATAYLTRLSI